MAPTVTAATAARLQRATAPARAPTRRPARAVVLRAVETRRRPPAPRRRPVAMVVSLVLAVGSLLSVADAQAYLTQGQVRLARLQQQLTGEQARHRDLELQVADLEDPSQVVNKAQQQGLTVPAQVTDLPLVATPASLAHATAPATTSPSTDRSGGRR